MLKIVALANPLSSDMDVLRPSLLPGLIQSLRHNVTRKNYDVALFEVGRVFTASQRRRRRKNAASPSPSPASATPTFWSGDDRDAKFDVVRSEGLRSKNSWSSSACAVFTFTRRADSTALFLESATIHTRQQTPLGELGQLCPTLAKKYDLRDAVLLGGVQSGSAARPAESGEVVQAAAAIPVQSAATWRCSCRKPRRTTRCCRP